MCVILEDSYFLCNFICFEKLWGRFLLAVFHPFGGALRVLCVGFGLAACCRAELSM